MGNGANTGGQWCQYRQAMGANSDKQWVPIQTGDGFQYRQVMGANTNG